LEKVRAWLRAFGPLRLLDDCAALMLIENGDEAEDDVRRALAARPPLMQAIALRIVLRAMGRHRAQADPGSASEAREPVPPTTADAHEALRRSA
jgi:hypothetical protein